MNIAYRHVGLAGGVAIAAVVAACTLFGNVVGRAIDDSRPPPAPQHVPGWEVRKLSVGERITIVLKDGSQISGRYGGPARDPNTFKVKPGFIALERDKMEPVSIAVDSIERVVVFPEDAASGTATVVGTAIGVGIDLFLIGLLSYELGKKDEKPRPERDAGEGHSCPLVFGFDGSQYRLEAELFGGATNPFLQRSDVVALAHARTEEETCRVRIAADANETDYMDRVALIVADHPKGTRVLPDANGTPRTVGKVSAPRRASDLRGRDVTQEVIAADDRWCFGIPFGRDPRTKEELRDGVIAEFERPAGSREARLVLRVVNTEWGAHLQARLVALSPPMREQLNHALVHDPATREAMARTLMREGMLSVQWAAANEPWRQAGYVWAASPKAPREVVVDLPSTHSAATSIRVKLDSTVGLWMIDQIALDEQALPNPATKEIAAVDAMDEQERSRLDELAAVDGRWLELGPGDSVDLRFDTGAPLNDTMERTVLIVGTGWYRIHSSPDPVAPSMDLPRLERILREPGAFAIWSLELAEAYRRRLQDSTTQRR